MSGDGISNRGGGGDGWKGKAFLVYSETLYLGDDALSTKPVMHY